MAYLAPEQEKGRYHGERVDEWAVAIVGLEVLGYRNRGRIDSREQLGRVRGWIEDFERGRGKERHPIATVCREMLAWEPEERMTAKRAVEVLLGEFGDGMGNRDGKRNGAPLDREGKKGLGV